MATALATLGGGGLLATGATPHAASAAAAAKLNAVEIHCIRIGTPLWRPSRGEAQMVPQRVSKGKPKKELAPEYIERGVETLAVRYETERKTGAIRAVRAPRTLRLRDGGLDLLRRAA